jgi:hypothetical protein
VVIVSEEVKNPGHGQKTDSLNQDQARILRANCHYIDELLSSIEHIVESPASNAAFSLITSDLSPAQQKKIEECIAAIRALLIRVLERQEIPRQRPDIPASRAVHVTLVSVENALLDMQPEYLQKYGPVSGPAAEELKVIVGEICALVDRLDHSILDAGKRG